MLILKNGNYIVKDETDFSVIPEMEMAYDEKVIALIREKYSLDEELAIQRQRDTKPQEFEEYFTYCENCKLRAKAQ